MKNFTISAGNFYAARGFIFSARLRNSLNNKSMRRRRKSAKDIRELNTCLTGVRKTLEEVRKATKPARPPAGPRRPRRRFTVDPDFVARTSGREAADDSLSG